MHTSDRGPGDLQAVEPGERSARVEHAPVPPELTIGYPVAFVHPAVVALPVQHHERRRRRELLEHRVGVGPEVHQVHVTRHRPVDHGQSGVEVVFGVRLDDEHVGRVQKALGQLIGHQAGVGHPVAALRPAPVVRHRLQQYPVLGERWLVVHHPLAHAPRVVVQGPTVQHQLDPARLPSSGALSVVNQHGQPVPVVLDVRGRRGRIVIALDAHPLDRHPLLHLEPVGVRVDDGRFAVGDSRRQPHEQLRLPILGRLFEVHHVLHVQALALHALAVVQSHPVRHYAVDNSDFGRYRSGRYDHCRRPGVVVQHLLLDVPQVRVGHEQVRATVQLGRLVSREVDVHVLRHARALVHDRGQQARLTVEQHLNVIVLQLDVAEPHGLDGEHRVPGTVFAVDQRQAFRIRRLLDGERGQAQRFQHGDEQQLEAHLGHGQRLLGRVAQVPHGVYLVPDDRPVAVHHPDVGFGYQHLDVFCFPAGERVERDHVSGPGLVDVQRQPVRGLVVRLPVAVGHDYFRRQRGARVAGLGQQALDSVALDRCAVLDALEQLQRIVVHHERLGRARYGVVVLE